MGSHRHTTTTGFTLIEMLLSLALVALLAGLSAPVYQALQLRNDLDTAATTFAQTARRAQALAQASDGDTSWGVVAGNEHITLFRGASYGARNTAYDEVFSLPMTITASGLTEIVYTKFTGSPQQTGTLSLTSNDGTVRTLTINAKGTVTY